MRVFIGMLVGVFAVAAGCQNDVPSFPAKRPANLTVDVVVTGGIMGVHDTYALAGDHLKVEGPSNAHEVQLSDRELDEIYKKVLEISHVRNRRLHRNDIADDFYASMVATAGPARYEVTRDHEPSDVLALSAMLSRMDQARANGVVDVPSTRPDDFSLSLSISSMRGNRRGQWQARIDSRRSYVSDSNWSETEIRPTSEELDRLYATCRAIAASSVELPRAAPNDEDYYVTIVAGRRERKLAGSIRALPPDLRALFTGLRPGLDAMVPADGPPWPEATDKWLRLEMVVLDGADRQPIERYYVQGGRVSGLFRASAGGPLRNADFALNQSELDAIYARARDVANHPASPATTGEVANEVIHLILASRTERVRDSSRHQLDADVAALRQQLAATLAARSGR